MFTYKSLLLTALILCSLLAGRAHGQAEPQDEPAASPSATADAAPEAANPEDTTPQAATPAVATARPLVTVATTTAKATQLMDQTLSDNEKIQLQAAGQTFTGYYLAASQQPVKGAVILLADRDQHPASTSMINTLRHTLAQHHWHTLALGLTSNDGSNDAANDDASTAGNEPQHLAAASQYFNRMGIASIAIVAEGYSAGLALAEIAALPATSNLALPPKTPFKAVQAVIMLNANTLLDDGSDSLSDFKDQPVTLVDAYTLSDYQQQQQASGRQQTARRLNTAYQQIRLPAMSSVQLADSNRVSQRIRGWLDKHMNSQLNKPPGDDQAQVVVK